jgi:hypothetical protein
MSWSLIIWIRFQRKKTSDPILGSKNELKISKRFQRRLVACLYICESDLNFILPLISLLAPLSTHEFGNSREGGEPCSWNGAKISC